LTLDTRGLTLASIMTGGGVALDKALLIQLVGSAMAVACWWLRGLGQDCAPDAAAGRRGGPRLAG
jgi:hypothetical protein